MSNMFLIICNDSIFGFILDSFSNKYIYYKNEGLFVLNFMYVVIKIV